MFIVEESRRKVYPGQQLEVIPIGFPALRDRLAFWPQSPHSASHYSGARGLRWANWRVRPPALLPVSTHHHGDAVRVCAVRVARISAEFPFAP